LARWTVLLRDLDARAPDRELASGSTPLDRAAVASLVGTELRRGGHYALVLDAVSTNDAVTSRQLRFSIPDRRYALVPLEPSVPPVFFTAFEMDDAGTRFVRWHWSERRFELYDATTGDRFPIALPLELDYSDSSHLSDDGRRLAFGGTPPEGGRLFGVFDIDSRVLSLLPYEPFYFDLDTAGQWLVGTNTGLSRYQLFDTVDGVRIPLNEMDQENDEDCRPISSGRPLISADGTVAVFASGIDLGIDAPSGCNVYAYDRPGGVLRLVLSLGRTDVVLPSLDDAATTFAAVVGPDLRGTFEDPRVTLIDLASGTTEDVLGDDPSAAFDAAITGNGRGVVISSCADLDPTVGNTDHNLELFLYDRDTATFRQITDSRGGPVACTERGGGVFAPDVNTDGSRLAFGLLHDYPGPPRTLRNDFAFATVRAVLADDANNPPTLDAPEAQRVEVYSVIDLRFVAGDPDADPLARFAQLDRVAELPVNASFVEEYGGDRSLSAFFWVAGPNDVGAHLLRVGAFDGRGGEAIREVPLTVCRRFLEPGDVAAVIAAIFEPAPPACGDADANGDGGVSAADLPAGPPQQDVASRRRRAAGFR
jgi:hypothetical protein